MQIINIFTNEIVTNINENISLCVGNFDGVHLGHKSLISKTINNPYHYSSAVWTFRIDSNRASNIIYTEEQKLNCFKELGVKYVLLEDFDVVRNLTKEQFVHLLYNEYKVRHAVCGYNFTFGFGASGNAKDFENLFSKYDIKTEIVEPIMLDDKSVSSSLIRSYILNGELEKVNDLLSRPYSYHLKISKGNRIGNTIGFPTINQILPAYLIKPKFGVYASKTIVNDKTYFSISNIGLRPTIKEENKEVICETHIFDYDGDLYDKTIKVELYKFIREEKQFTSVNELKNEISNNIFSVKEYFSN